MFIVGSSTLYPFTTAVAEDFTRHHPGAPSPVVEATGTGGGIKLFCAGVGARFPDMVNASRRMRPGELAQCAQHGVKHVLELPVGIDGIVLAQKKGAGTFSLSEADVYRALAARPLGQAQQAQNWRAIDPRLSARPIRFIGPSSTSGTRDSFDQLYMLAGCRAAFAARGAGPGGRALPLRACTEIREDDSYVEAGENDNLIVQKLASDPNAIGILGFSYLDRNRDKVEGIAVDGVAPTERAITDGRYPAARLLYLYAKIDHLPAVHGMAAFLHGYMAEGTIGPGGSLARRGLIPLPPPLRAEGRARLARLVPLAERDLAGDIALNPITNPVARPVAGEKGAGQADGGQR